MNQRSISARLFAAAITTLLTASLVGFSGLVFCIGSDGHRAVEFDHAGMTCPTLAGPSSNVGLSTQAPAKCLDLPAAGSLFTSPSSSDAEQVPMPPRAFLTGACEPAPSAETLLSAPTEPRAGPPRLALHLSSTVLLV